MTYKLYGCRRSGSLIVELALSKIGVDYEIREVDLESNAQRSDAYLTVNPLQKVPALLTPNGELLTQSVAILLTLDERHPQAHLLPPAGSADRASALRTLLFVATELYPIVEINDYPERFTATAKSVSEVREKAARTLASAMADRTRLYCWRSVLATLRIHRRRYVHSGCESLGSAGELDKKESTKNRDAYGWRI